MNPLLQSIQTASHALPGPLPAWHALLDAAEWRQAIATLLAKEGRLISTWGTDARALGEGRRVAAAVLAPDGLFWLETRATEADGLVPTLADLARSAERMERATFDLTGIRAAGAPDERPWLRHDAWPAGEYPLARDPETGSLTGLTLQPGPTEASASAYPFVVVEGDGVHEIPVGPVHAGTIEPGHFRFSVVGEKVLRLEERLGYTHKGVEQRFMQLTPLEGARLAGRISGDTTVAYAWAHALAVEGAGGAAVPERARWLRALLCERERVQNHLGDLGALGNDAGLGFGLMQFQRLREDWLRANSAVFGHRLMMDAVCPGGVGCDVSSPGLDRLRRQCDEVRQAVESLQHIYDEHAGVQDRFVTTGRVTAELARLLGMTGMAARASGMARDLRLEWALEPYPALAVRPAVRQNGDVAARVAVRFDEIYESLRLIEAISAALPEGPHQVTCPAPAARTRGLGCVEGWRGPVLCALETGPGGATWRLHIHDPSWHNWPALEHAVLGNIVPDFPLINKSFNLSYSGHDL